MVYFGPMKKIFSPGESPKREIRLSRSLSRDRFLQHSWPAPKNEAA
jgi:hypothetical protein